jgi:CubicO group peptidase (beta-lactamase class C family)
MLDRRSLLLAGAGVFTHIGPSVIVPTVSQTLKGVLDDTAVPALGYAVIGPKGPVTLEVGGRRRVDAPESVGPDDAWHLGSNTEALTTALYARLVERKQALWRAKPGLLFPDLTIHPAWSETPIEAFMSHSAGLSDIGVIDEGWLIRTRGDKRRLQDQRTALVARILAEPPNGRPQDYEYSNLDYVVVGAAVERITRGPWERALSDEVFAPLSLLSGGFGAPLGDEPWGHDIGSQGAPDPVNPAVGVADNPAVLAPGGQVHLSLPDYARFVGVFLNAGGDFLSPDSLAHLARPHDAFAEGDGLGWRVTPSMAWAKGPVLSHEGSNTLWRALVEVAPAVPLAVIVVTNSGGEPGARAVQMMSSRLISQQREDS